MSKLSMHAAIVTLAAALFLPNQTIAQNEHDQLTREKERGGPLNGAKDERIGAKQLYEDREFLFRLVKELGSN